MHLDHESALACKRWIMRVHLDALHESALGLLECTKVHINHESAFGMRVYFGHASAPKCT